MNSKTHIRRFLPGLLTLVLALSLFALPAAAAESSAKAGSSSTAESSAPEEKEYPKTGVLTEKDDSEFGVLRVKVPKGNPTYIKIYNKETDKICKTLFINSGETLTTRMPKGEFIVKYASGEKWYGQKEMFGEAGSYNKCDTVFKFHTRDEGYEITLEKVKDGNLGSVGQTQKTF